MSKITVIPAEKLGVLEHQFQTVGHHRLKNDRRLAFNRLSRVLKGLRLIEEAEEARTISFGVDSTGGFVAVVTSEVTTRVQGEMPK